MPGVGPVRLRHETGLHPVKCRVERVVLDPKVRKHAGDDLCDQRLRSLLERNLCGCAGEKRQATRLEKAHAFVFALYRNLMCVSLEVLRENISQSIKVTLQLQSQGYYGGGIRGEIDRLKLHNHGESVVWDIASDGKELDGPVFLRSTQLKKECRTKMRPSLLTESRASL